MLSDIRSKIIKIILDDGNRKIPPGIIVRKMLDQFPYLLKSKIFNEIEAMKACGALKSFTDNKVALGYIDAEVDLSTRYEGVISINTNHDGYIKLFNEHNELVEEFYVNKIHLNSALRGDLVEFALLKKDCINCLREASVTKVIKRNKSFCVGQIIFDQDNNYQFVPDDNKMYLNVVISNINVANNNDKVLLTFDDIKDDVIYATITRNIGNKYSLGIDIESIVYDNNVPVDFSDAVIQASENLVFEITEKDKKLRRDIRDRKIITIDPATSKDLDDAVFVDKLPNNNYFLSVSIADVSSYVKFNSQLDNSAFERGTSVYLVDRVIPMLPTKISDNLCSLNENEDKFALTCDMEIDHDGNIVDIEVFPSIMKNYHRFSYDEVNGLFTTNFSNCNLDSQIVQSLKYGYELHSILRTRKHQDGYIEFDIKEPLIKLDAKGVPISIDVKKSGLAQKMIEDFMVAANEAVTIFAKDHKLNFIYRTHDKPEAKKINNFLIEAKKIGVLVNIDYASFSSKDFLKLIEKNKNLPISPIISKLLLRAMQKAKYDTSNIGHFGLALNNYTHFTSPIRRYADLIVHRLFWFFIFDKDGSSAKEKAELLSKLNEITKQCNLTEIRQVETERTVNSMKFAEYMSYRIGQKFDGIVSTVTPYGLFIELGNLIEGFVQIRNIGPDFYIYNDTNFTIANKNNTDIYSIGRSVKVEVIYANKEDRRIDFKII